MSAATPNAPICAQDWAAHITTTARFKRETAGIRYGILPGPAVPGQESESPDSLSSLLVTRAIDLSWADETPTPGWSSVMRRSGGSVSMLRRSHRGISGVISVSSAHSCMQHSASPHAGRGTPPIWSQAVRVSRERRPSEPSTRLGASTRSAASDVGGVFIERPQLSVILMHRHPQNAAKRR